MLLKGHSCTWCLESSQAPLYCKPRPKKNSRLLSEKSNKNKINNNKNNNKNNNNKNNNKVTTRTALLAVKKWNRKVKYCKLKSIQLYFEVYFKHAIDFEVFIFFLIIIQVLCQKPEWPISAGSKHSGPPQMDKATLTAASHPFQKKTKVEFMRNDRGCLTFFRAVRHARAIAA